MILKHPSERCTHVVRGLRWAEVDGLKQLLTSFGLFFAGATPVKPDRETEGKKKRKMLPKELEHLFHIKIKGKFKKRHGWGKKD